MADLYYSAGWQTSDNYAATLNGSPWVWGGSSTYSHVSLEAFAGTGNFPNFGIAVQTALIAFAGGTWTCTLDTTTWLYTIVHTSGGNYTLNFASTDPAAVAFAGALGFKVDFLYTGAATYTGSYRPFYLMVPIMLGRSTALPIYYEPGEIVEEATSDGGTPFATSKDTIELWADWSQTMEAKENCFNIYATVDVPYTWQQFWRDVRGYYPWAAMDPIMGDFIFTFRASTGSFHALPVVADWTELFNLKFETRFHGPQSEIPELGFGFGGPPP